MPPLRATAPKALLPLPTTLIQRVQHALHSATLILLALIALITVTHQVIALTHRYPLDYGEAPLVDQALRLARGVNIYRADLSHPPYTISNYPPLYVATMAPFVAVFGPGFAPGRLISILAAWVSALCVGRVVWNIYRDRLAAGVAGLIFLAFPFVAFWSSLARIDLLALALSLSGLSVVTRSPTSDRRTIAAALLLTAAIFTRQSYGLAAPLAAFVWLLLQEDFRRAFGLVGVMGLVGGGSFLLLNALTEGGFYFHIVTANANAWKADNLSWNLNRFIQAAPVLLSFGLIAMALGAQRNRGWGLVAPYLVGAFLTFLTVGKVGSNVNYMLELCAALSIATGGVLAWARERSPWLSAAAAILIALQGAHMARLTAEKELSGLQARVNQAADLKHLEDLIAQADGAVLADEYMGLLTLQGRALFMQPFEVTQLALERKWDQSPLLRAIEAQEFPLILIYQPAEYPLHKERWTPQMLEMINRKYRLTSMYARVGVYQPIGKATLRPAAIEQCPGAHWRLPATARNGARLEGKLLDFFDHAKAGTSPVVAVAGGTVFRAPDWHDAIAVLHDDPLVPGRKVWTFYSHLADGFGDQSFVAARFPPGTRDVAITAGETLGFQGNWSGRAGFPMWVHVRFAVVRPTEDGSFPATLDDATLLDPRLYLRLVSPAANGGAQTLRCAP